jgi:hypothetical protein
MEPTPKNPARVPPPVVAAEPRQEGAPRTIHPIGSPPLPVGSEAARQEQARRGVISMDTSRLRGQAFVVEADETREYTDERGHTHRRRFRKGDRIGLGLAHQFGLVDAPGAGLARPTDEKPDVAPTEQQAETAETEEPARRRTNRGRGPAETTEAVGPAETAEADTGE